MLTDAERFDVRPGLSGLQWKGIFCTALKLEGIKRGGGAAAGVRDWDTETNDSVSSELSEMHTAFVNEIYKQSQLRRRTGSVTLDAYPVAESLSYAAGTGP